MPVRVCAADLEKKAASLLQEETFEAEASKGKGTAESETKGTADPGSKGAADLENKGTAASGSRGTADSESKGTADSENRGSADPGSDEAADSGSGGSAVSENDKPEASGNIDPVQLEDSELPAPADPGAYTKGKLIFIGDSRTVDIMNAVHDNSIWSCRVGKGYNWMSGTGVPDIEGEIEKNTSVIFLMGVNDPSNLKHYINYINAKANEWAALGAQTYFVSVGPVTGDPYVTNDQIEIFNASMEASLAGVIYIDIYNYLMDTGFSTIDGTHYPDWISISIYNYILEHLEPEGDGIWG